jgi:hypothetical protein
MKMKILGVTLLVAAMPLLASSQSGFRPPAVPLVTSDPYLSIWSESDTLNGDVTRHWTHAPHALVSLIRVDGKAFRLMGNEPDSVPPMSQISLSVTATRTTYTFANVAVKVRLEFLTPALPDDLDVLTRPVTYLTWSVESVDGNEHQVELYDSTSSQISVNSTDQAVNWHRRTANGLTLLSAGTDAQPYLRPAGDDTRIDWGQVYAVAKTSDVTSGAGSSASLASSFVATGTVPSEVDHRMPRPTTDGDPALAFVFAMGEVGSKPVSRQVMVGYDEIYAIQYFGQKLAPYWRRNGATPASLFTVAAKDYPSLNKRAAAFDQELAKDATKVGGAKYAQILALSYRECLAANGIAADANKQPLLFTKENTSNGDIATVDVIFPMDPIFVLLSPTLAKASLESNFAYAASTHWKFPNAPHDLGTYPQVFGRDDGGEGMPVEESGNMILLTDAIAHAEGNPEYATRWWPQLTQWAKYLEQYGLDPEDQLCTDDFMGHLAHNANLSIKAILALAAYGDLAILSGDVATGERYKGLAKQYAEHFMKVADAGNRSLLAFDKPGTWSQKYNLVWDKILRLNVFPDSVAAKEIAYYKTVMQPYGVPLDSRTHLTKTDWSIWSATMATSLADFEAIVSPIYAYLNETTTRDPIADSYETDKVESGGMHARPVVGGFFIRLLSDPAIWKKWASKDHEKVGNWAPLPEPPKVEELALTARKGKVLWHYTTAKPSNDWFKASFDDSSWPEGAAAFGTEGTPGAIVGTTWNTDDIWIRRTVSLPMHLEDAKVAGKAPELKLAVYHDEDVEVYINGVLALSEPSYYNEYALFDISSEALKFVKPGAKITIAVHCHQTTGGQGVDVGIVKVVSP